jgi:hypothetical protein
MEEEDAPAATKPTRSKIGIVERVEFSFPLSFSFGVSLSA